MSRVEEEYSEDDFLVPETMLRLYANGAFPMADNEKGIIEWYMPKVRAIIPLDGYNYPRSLRKFMQSFDYEVGFDYDFKNVVEACADREETWISPKLIKAYRNLWNYGCLHTVEVYRNRKLIGGLYGVSIDGAFFGESMFSKEPQGSKIALMHLIWHLIKKKFTVLDVQILNPHLELFGAKEISLEEFDKLLEKAYSQEIYF